MTISLAEIAMILCGGLTLLSALGVVFARKPLHSALWLIVTFFLLAVNYALLRADFVAVLQVLIYAGAIMVLVIFVIMLIGPASDAEERRPLSFKIFLFLMMLWFVTLVLGILMSAPGVVSDLRLNNQFVGDIKSFGKVLFTKYLWAFEITGILLLATTIGVTLLAKEPKRVLPPGRGLKAKQVEEQEDDVE
jgi:NADH-quinone oxidoreductase subunit J